MNATDADEIERPVRMLVHERAFEDSERLGPNANVQKIADRGACPSSNRLRANEADETTGVLTLGNRRPSLTAGQIVFVTNGRLELKITSSVPASSVLSRRLSAHLPNCPRSNLPRPGH